MVITTFIFCLPFVMSAATFVAASLVDALRDVAYVSPPLSSHSPCSLELDARASAARKMRPEHEETSRPWLPPAGCVFQPDGSKRGKMEFNDERYQERMRQLNLKYTRMRIKSYERSEPLLEWKAELDDRDGDYEAAARAREDIRRNRKEIQRLKKIERGLWEQQPGGIEAPAPRPVKQGEGSP